MKRPHEDVEENDVAKAEKNRQRNREHAKKTRLRKKEMMEGMKARLLGLQQEAARLEQLLEESNTANILLCLSTTNKPTSNEGSTTPPTSTSTIQPSSVLMKGNIVDHLRHKVRVEAAAKFHHLSPIISPTSATSSHPHHQKRKSSLTKQDSDHTDMQSMSSKGSIFTDGDHHSQEHHHDHDDTNSIEESLGHSGDELDQDVLKRERNRIHAKLTRDRKKLFTITMQETMDHLEEHIQHLKTQLQENLHLPTFPAPLPLTTTVTTTSPTAIFIPPTLFSQPPPPLSSLFPSPVPHPVPHLVPPTTTIPSSSSSSLSSSISAATAPSGYAVYPPTLYTNIMQALLPPATTSTTTSSITATLPLVGGVVSGWGGGPGDIASSSSSSESQTSSERSHGSRSSLTSNNTSTSHSYIGSNSSSSSGSESTSRSASSEELPSLLVVASPQPPSTATTTQHHHHHHHHNLTV